MANHKPKNILITGAAGFIASHVANRLIRNYSEYRIIVLDKLDYCSNLKNLDSSRSSPNFKFVKGDIRSADLVNYLLDTESIDTIMHFAAQTHVDNSFKARLIHILIFIFILLLIFNHTFFNKIIFSITSIIFPSFSTTHFSSYHYFKIHSSPIISIKHTLSNSFEFIKNNVYGTYVLLEACKTFGLVGRFIHVSTDEVYGETDENAVMGNVENSQLLPTNPYSASKAGAEMLVLAYGRSYGLPVIITRGNNVYGTHQFPEKLVPKFILLAMKGKHLPIHGDGSNIRSYLYCEDVAEAFDIILHRGEVGHVYNIGTDEERRVVDVARDICRLFSLNPDAVIKFVENRPFNDQRYFLDTQKLKNLGWSDRTSWEDGLRLTAQWYMRNHDWWGDVSGALLLHPRMLSMPNIEKENNFGVGALESSYVLNDYGQDGQDRIACHHKKSITAHKSRL